MKTGVFAKLLLSDDDLATVVKGLEAVIWKSFAEDARRRIRESGLIIAGGGSQVRPTESEITRRFDICVKWFQIMRGDLKWSVQRCVDHLNAALRTELDGGQWTPPGEKRISWNPPALEQPKEGGLDEKRGVEKAVRTLAEGAVT